MASRQRLWQLRKVKQGRCIICGEKAVKKGYCAFHYQKKQEQVKRWQDQQKEKVSND